MLLEPDQIPLNPLVNKRNYGKSPSFMGKSTINGNYQWLFVSLPEGKSPGVFHGLPIFFGMSKKKGPQFNFSPKDPDRHLRRPLKSLNRRVMLDQP